MKQDSHPGPGVGSAPETESFLVLINGEEQYSLWPSDQPTPPGWSPVGPERSKSDCLAYIEANWTDMRPKSLRMAMTSGNSRKVAPEACRPIHQ